MKKLILGSIILACLLVASCGKDNIVVNTKLVGRWKLDAVYADPGDGSGKYTTVDNAGNNGLEFEANGGLKVSGLTENDRFVFSFSQYNRYAFKDSTTLVFKNSADTTIRQNFVYQIKDSKLTLIPAGPIRCIEGCGVRFKK